MATPNKLGKRIIHICEIHTVKEKAFVGGPNGGVEKKEL